MAKSTRIRTGKVLENRDPNAAGRVLVQIAPEGRAKAPTEVWAHLTAQSAGADHGLWFPPEVGDQVLIAFEGGAADNAYVIGALWGAKGGAPHPGAKALQTRSGLAITFDESGGAESIHVTTPDGQSITLQDGPGAIVIADDNGNALRLDASGVTITAATKVRIQANVVELSAGLVNIEAGAAHVSGIVQCDTLIANSVISASYTPGAGNLF